MKMKAFFIALIYFCLITLLTFNFSHSFFSSTGSSTNNVFAAASVFPTPTPPIAQTLVINEVLPDSSCSQGETKAQWIEVYNGFSTTVSLKDFKITDGTNTIALVDSANATIAPGAFVLLAHSTSIFGNGKCYDNHGADIENLGGSLNINVGHLQLLNSSSQVIDDIQWGGNTGLSPQQNQSIERVPAGKDSATGSNFASSDFIIREMPTPGFGTQLVLNELLPDPKTIFTDEKVEIYNAGSSAVNLTGWTLKDASTAAKFLTPLGSISGQNRVVYTNPGDSWLNNSTPETLQLIDNSGKIVDQHSYTGSSPDKTIGRSIDAGNIWKNCTTQTIGSSNNGSC